MSKNEILEEQIRKQADDIKVLQEELQTMTSWVEQLQNNKTFCNRDLLGEWVERLGLQDWRIKLKTNQTADQMCTDAAGNVDFIEEIRCAVIRIVSEDEYHKDSVLEYDFEKILVHELLHIKFSLFDNTRWEDKANISDRHLHQLIDDMARALVCAKRGILKIGIKEDDSDA